MGPDEITVSNGHGLAMTLSSFGARLVELNLPDRNGLVENVVLGFDGLAPYEQHANLYLGSTIGRVAGRVAGGHFLSGGLDLQLDPNEGDNHLHGGRHRSFDRVEWSVAASHPSLGAGVIFEYVSPHGEEGYPGTLHARAEYALSEDNELRVVLTATCDRTTPVNLTNHTYWNLAGGNVPITGHQLMIQAHNTLATSADLIPTGSLVPVPGTALDYRQQRRIGDALPEGGGEPWPGLDHTYLLDDSDGSLRRAAILYDPDSGRSVELFTTEPALQVYSANRLPALQGRNGVSFAAGHALCLEPQKVPDSPALPGLPSIVVPAAQEYRHVICYKFRTR
ncbi:aldose epimerase family protein [Arthrobacter globiformis]|uniref:aldose epimerase family protein n=1 Tax=Arthrobacter globiformis TaxID=1665 RepID=UPI0027D7D64C|nr:aldose epimerase family protein [Arthrobacter globiformis]